MYHNKKLISKLLLVVACFLVACEQRSPAPVASDGKGPNGAYPTTLANMNGWHGIQVIRSQSNGRMNCSVLFPANFGIAEDEKNLLLHMVAKRITVRGETDCWVAPDDIALNQLLRLAVEKQNPAAATLLLYRGTTDMPFNLDGDAAESYTEDYLISLLEKYERLDTVLDQAMEHILAKSICANLQKYDDMKDPTFKKRIHLLVKRLNTKGMGRFAREIESCDLSRPPGQ